MNLSTSKFTVALIGLGSIAPLHIDALNYVTQAKLVAVCDPLEKTSNVLKYTDYCKLLKEIKPDVVHILTPHYLHAPMVIEALRQGIHVLCEKPIALNEEEIKAIKAELTASQAKLGVVMQNRFNPTVMTLKQALNKQTLGKMLGMKAILTWSRSQSYYDASSWRGSKEQSGSGLLFNQAIHTLDLMLLLGGTITSHKTLYGKIQLLKVDIEDTCVADFTFESGAKGLFIGTNAYIDNSSVNIEVICEKGIYQIRDHQLIEITDKSEVVLMKDPLPKHKKIYYGPSHTRLIQEFYKALANEGGKLIDIDTASKVILLMESMLKVEGEIGDEQQ